MFRLSVLALCVVFTVALAGPAVAAATTMTVNDGGDGSAAGVCTLRDAIVAADTHAQKNGCPAGSGNDVVLLAVPTVTLSIAGSHENSALTGDLDVTGSVTIEGAVGGTTVDAAGLDRVLDIAVNGQVNLQDLTLTGGLAPAGVDGSGFPGNAAEDGGGIRNAGSLTLARVIVSGDATSHGGAGTSGSAAGGTGGQGGRGGGIASTGSLTMTESTVTNDATGAGGSGGSGTGASGSSGNHAGTEGDGGDGGTGGDGGGIYSTGASVVIDSTISDNRTGSGGAGGAGHGGAGLSLSDGEAGGAGAPGFGGNGGFGGSGAGIAAERGTLTLSGSLVSADVAGSGGAGGVGVGGSGGNGEVAGSGTGAGGGGGAGHGGRGGFGGAGGGLYSNFLITGSPSSTELSATSDTITADATGRGGNGGGGSGGAGGKSNAANAGNGGNGLGGDGGAGGSGGGAEENPIAGIFDPLVLVADTLTDNAAALGGSPATGVGGLAGSGAPDGTPGGSAPGAAGPNGDGGGEDGAAVTDSVIASDTPDGCSSVDLGKSARNIVFPDASCPGTLADPRLGPLVDNGGPTRTMRLLAGSPAIDAVAVINAGCPATDQRGLARPQGAACDAGAYELAAPGATTGPAAATATTATLTATVEPNKQQTTVYFVWGPAAGPGQRTADETLTRGTVDAKVGASIGGLIPATTYRYHVVATNADGTTTGQDQTFTAQAAPAGTGTATTGTSATGPTTTTPSPVLTRLTLTPQAFRPATKAHRSHRGTAISYTDTAAAKTTFTIQRRFAGIVTGGRCVAAPKKASRGTRPKRCARYVLLRGRFTHSDAAGLNALRWSGALLGKPLRPGRYRLSARPVVGTAAGAAVIRAFTIKR